MRQVVPKLLSADGIFVDVLNTLVPIINQMGPRLKF
jgi:hypothetical protein